jgi:fused signal recognition particle receptor
MGIFKKFKNLISGKKNISEQIKDVNKSKTLIEQNKFDDGLKRSSSTLQHSINEIAKKYRRLDDDLIESIEELLLSFDVGSSSTQKILTSIVDEIKFQNVTDPELIKQIIIDKIFVYYIQDTNVDTTINLKQGKCNVILITGVNGVGKTTTIAKLAHRFKLEGLKVCLVAGDTFRAGAIQQLNV